MRTMQTDLMTALDRLMLLPAGKYRRGAYLREIARDHGLPVKHLSRLLRRYRQHGPAALRWPRRVRRAAPQGACVTVLYADERGGREGDTDA